MKSSYETGRYQAGMTMYGMMFVMVAIGLAATAAIKLGPHYMDNNVVKNALSEMQISYANADLQDISDKEIIGKLNRYFEVNMVGDEIAKAGKVTREKQKVILSVNYEVRTGFMGNVDFVMVFNNEVDLAK